jgi:hypothetical protein
LRVHSGWAALVVLSGPSRSPVVLDRRRIDLVESGSPEARQPYHAVEGWDVARAAAQLAEWKRRARALAGQSLRAVVGRLRTGGHEVIGSGLLLGSGRLPSNLARILSSHALIHTADGEHYRDALRGASERCRVSVTGVRERDLLAEAARSLRVPPKELTARVGALGRELGPPWTQDQKQAALVAWVVLSEAVPEAGSSKSRWRATLP